MPIYWGDTLSPRRELPPPVRNDWVELCPVKGCLHPIRVRNWAGLGEGRANEAISAHVVYAHFAWAVNRGDA